MDLTDIANGCDPRYFLARTAREVSVHQVDTRSIHIVDQQGARPNRTLCGQRRGRGTAVMSPICRRCQQILMSREALSAHLAMGMKQGDPR